MPGKTNSDLIRDLNGFVNRLQERSDNDRRDVERLQALNTSMNETLAELRERLAVVETRLADLKSAQDERDRRRWTIWLAVVGSVLTLAANIALVVLKR